MSDTKHTPGPWRWEFNAAHKVLHLIGGRPQYDLTIMDFDRWGMNRAVATLRDTSEDGMNIMHRLCDRKDWIAPFLGRAHHANWCADVVHPDMRLMASAPDLLDALLLVAGEVTDYVRPTSADSHLPSDIVAAVHAAIAKATGANHA